MWLQQGGVRLEQRFERLLDEAVAELGTDVPKNGTETTRRDSGDEATVASSSSNLPLSGARTTSLGIAATDDRRLVAAVESVLYDRLNRKQTFSFGLLTGSTTNSAPTESEGQMLNLGFAARSRQLTSSADLKKRLGKLFGWGILTKTFAF